MKNIITNNFVFIATLIPIIFYGCCFGPCETPPIMGKRIDRLICDLKFVDSNSAILTFQFDGDTSKNLNEKGICWSTKIDPTRNDSVINIDTGRFKFEVMIKDLKPNTQYNARAFVTNSNGLLFSENITITTKHIKYYTGGPGPTGGIIFWLDDKDGGVELAPEYTDTLAPWGCEGTYIYTKTEFGSGFTNSSTIIKICNETGFAAKICKTMNVGGETNWFLPSRKELDSIFRILASKAKGGMKPGRYWSSSEFNSDRAMWVSMPDGSSGYDSKNVKYRVRAIRRF